MSVEGIVPAAVVDESNPQQTETPKIEVPKKEDDFLAPKFAALTRKEKEIRARENAIKAQQSELEKMRSEWESKSKSATEQESQLLSELKKNPLKFMEKHGLTFEQLTDMQLNEQNPTPQMLMDQMRAELEAKMEEKYGKLTETLKEKEEREVRERYEAAVNSYKSEINQFMTQNADTYELIAANGATDLMFETAEAYYAETGKVPDLKEVANAVEQHLEEQANQIFKLKKFQKLQPPQNSEANPAGKPAQTAPTLSNTLSAEVPKSGAKFMSDEESKKAAAKLLVWNE